MKEMGFFIILIILISFNAAQCFRIHVQRVAGIDENEQKEIFMLQQFRVLLGFKSFVSFNGDSKTGSPSPSPAPAIEAVEAPPPRRAVRIHPHSRSPPHKKLLNSDRDGNRERKILLIVLVCSGFVLVVSVTVIFVFCQRYKRNRNRRSLRLKYVTSSNSAKRVSFDPGLDLFQLNSLGVLRDLESRNTVNTKSKQSCAEAWNRSISNQETETEKLDSDNVSCSSTREIFSVHDEDEESVKNESLSDESFHSPCNSHSSNVRHSNASEVSLGDATENLVHPKVPPPPPPPPPPAPLSQPWVRRKSDFSSLPKETRESKLLSSFPETSPSVVAIPPPPPPPPSRPSAHVLSRNSDFSSVSKETRENDLPSSLPKTSKSELGIPPPPPYPPPSMKGSYNTPPPPPPFQMAVLGKDGAPLPKLKPLHWDKVRAASERSMVWDRLRCSSFELDEEMMESLFGYNELGSSTQKEEGKSKSPSPSKHVLEPKRLQNITILSKALNATPDHVCEKVLQGNGLGLQQLEALVKMVPTREEEAKLCNYKGDINELGSAEKFVKAILSIPFAFLRIEAMLYRETFEDEVVHLRKSFSMLEEACNELRSSRLFLKLLEAVLKTGNRMNVGTIRGGAKAFKLDALLKLSDVKGTDGKTTLLHFVVQEIVRSEGMRMSESIIGKINHKTRPKTNEEKEEDYHRMGLDLVSGLGVELYNVKKTASIDLDVLENSVSNLSDGMTKVKQLVNSDLLDERGGSFVKSMGFFLGHAEKNLRELKEEEDRVSLRVREITEYFHGNLSKDEANPLRIFVIVRDFLGMLGQVCKELRSFKVTSCPNPLAPFR